MSDHGFKVGDRIRVTGRTWHGEAGTIKELVDLPAGVYARIHLDLDQPTVRTMVNIKQVEKLDG